MAIESDSEKVGIVGLGSVGLPLAILFARAGVPLVLLEKDSRRRSAIERRVSPLAHLGDEQVRELGDAVVCGEASALAACTAVIICVPTPLDDQRRPDLRVVEAAAREVAEHVPLGSLVVLESTTWPGTTREVLGGIFEGKGVELAYSPERVDPGRDVGGRLGGDVPKLVGGLTALGTERATGLYARAFETVVPVSSTEVAEAAKLVENVHRAVNIALVGELKVAFDAMGIDIWEVLDAASTKPFGFTRFDPGPGMGGHCLPIDPFYLAWAAKRAGAGARFVELSGEINRAMPSFVASKVRLALGSRGIEVGGARVLLIGVAYKAGVDIVEESPAFPLASELRQDGARITYHDPLVPMCELGESRPFDVEQLDEADVAVVLVAQPGVDLSLLEGAGLLVVDTRAALRGALGGDPRYFPA